MHHAYRFGMYNIQLWRGGSGYKQIVPNCVDVEECLMQGSHMFDNAQDDSRHGNPQQLCCDLHLLTGGWCHHASTPTADDEA